MHLDHDDILESCDALADTLLAAQRALEVMAAESLSFAAQVRVHRQSTRRARRWLRDNLDPEVAARVAPGSFRDEATDEILKRAVAEPQVPLDVGPEDDAVQLMTDDTDFTGDFVSDSQGEGSFSADSLVSFDEDLGIDDDGEELIIEIEDERIGDVDSLVAFDESPDSDGFATLAADDLISADDDSDDDLLSLDGEGDLVSLDGDDLVNISAEGGDLVTLGGDDGGDLVSFGDEGAIDTLDQVGSARPDAGEDQTLVTDLESLVKLQDLLTEDESSGAAHTNDRSPSPRGADIRTADPHRVATTLTEEDLGRLGFSSREEMISPEGSDADPSSETGSRPAIRLSSPQADARVRSNASAAVQTSYSPPDALGAPIPTIRNAQDVETRATAAIRIGADGVGSVVDEMEPLALGEADDEDLEDEVSGGGFSIGVEEYEYVDDEPEELPELKAPEPEPEPAPLPELSDDQAAVLMRQAVSAASRGDLQSAAQLFSDVLDFDPDNADAALGRGRVYLDLGDYARAMSDFTVAEEVRPDDAETNAAIGELYYARKDYTRAIDYFDAALKQNDEHAMAWCRRGIAHYYRKDYAKAYDDLVQAQKLDDSIPNIRTYIGMVKKKRK